ncbi:MAG: D-glycerate dehydrogenase [Burkholderiaceae bacterium]|nr:D-glycerate dehydrogenase [Burkholderiaceae bacterium]
MSARPTLLITRKVFPEVLERLAPYFDFAANQDDDDWPRAELLARAADRDALFVTGSDRIDRELIDACPRLRMIATGTVGYNHIDLTACGERGIAVSNTPDVLTEATADMAWALLMAAARRVCESEHWLRAGKWGRWAFDQWLGADVHGTTLGIVGMGRIGSAVARRARGFDMTILYHNRSRAANEAALGARRVELETLLRESDHVVLVVPYSRETHHLIGARELAAMKPTATLVNIARGGIVDDAALVEALRAGRIVAAGLDVYENEPKLHPGLLAVPNVALTPHIGSATRSTRVGMAMLAADNLVAFATGAPLKTPVATA